MKLLFTFLIILFIWNCSCAQISKSNDSTFLIIDTPIGGTELVDIGQRLLKGDKDALFKIARYLDTNRKMTEFLGYHILQTSERSIAVRLIDENCIFLVNELNLNDSITSKKFLSFLEQNDGNIHFDNDANAFLITPLINRDVKYEIRELSDNRKAELKSKSVDLLKADWVKKNNIDKLIGEKTPLALFKIAADLFKGRNRFNVYRFDAKEHIDLIEFLTGTEIAVEDEQHKINNHISEDFYTEPRLNLLIYFAKHYQSYTWNGSLGIFKDPSAEIITIDNEAIYFQNLSSETDSVAMNAFMKLTTCNAERVKVLATEYEKADVKSNFSLPIFPYRFLKQLTVLTAYCKSNGIDFIGSEQLRKNIGDLRSNLSFPVRRSLEDRMIKNLTLVDITAFEYWCLVYEQGDNLTYSAGRILDIFYSNNWSKIIGSKRYLDIYLKKATLFNNIAIVGISYKYLEKFMGAGAAEINTLKNNLSTDQDILLAGQKAFEIASKKIPGHDNINKSNGGNYDAGVVYLKNEFSFIIKNTPDSEKRDSKIQELFSKISYRQIDTALYLSENYKFKYKYQEFNFMERDFGFFMSGFEKPQVKADFLMFYKTHTEKEVYENYLKKAGIDYTNRDLSLNYDKIYELLKYDVVTAFAGGGGGTRDNEVYCLVKLLELHFKTTLGFPVKLCNSQNNYACNSRDRTKLWMDYLTERKLLKDKHNGPFSFNYFER